MARDSERSHFRITSPWHGDVLNLHDGRETTDSLVVNVSGAAPKGAAVTVNGTAAEIRGGSFQCPVTIRRRRTEISAVCRAEGAEHTDTITVLWDKASRPRYRLSVDDNIQFLKDLGTTPDDYPSLFDHWYLSFWRQMHEEFGAKIHINIYYQDEQRGQSPPRSSAVAAPPPGPSNDFTLARLPAKWKGEWEANAGWLRLSFHALQDQPDRPYEKATYDQIAHDFDLVTAEIDRFAGKAVMGPTTTVHWGSAPKDACRALHDRGIRVLIGIFRREFDGKCISGYYLPDDVKDHADERDAVYDPETDLLFVTEDATVNNLRVDEVVPWLERQAGNPHTGQLMELLIHEQYFRRDLPHFQPDVQEKVIRALRWVTEHGYEPVFWGDGFLGNEARV
jgi:hypothetical protein